MCIILVTPLHRIYLSLFLLLSHFFASMSLLTFRSLISILWSMSDVDLSIILAAIVT